MKPKLSIPFSLPPSRIPRCTAPQHSIEIKLALYISTGRFLACFASILLKEERHFPRQAKREQDEEGEQKSPGERESYVCVNFSCKKRARYVGSMRVELCLCSS
ncbi:hypothetical protein GOP47_0027886 [Adiantum capillus-veneris]|nr:hypothetical protein GOP47_0027886 [Adiantum capillus-veneris]